MRKKGDCIKNVLTVVCSCIILVACNTKSLPPKDESVAGHQDTISAEIDTVLVEDEKGEIVAEDTLVKERLAALHIAKGQLVLLDKRTFAIKDSAAYLTKKIAWLKSYFQADTLVSNVGFKVPIDSFIGIGTASIGACSHMFTLKATTPIEGVYLFSSNEFSSGEFQFIKAKTAIHYLNNKSMKSFYEDSVFNLTEDDRKYVNLNEHINDTVNGKFESKVGGPVNYYSSESGDFIIAKKGYGYSIEYDEGGYDYQDFYEKKIALKRNEQWLLSGWIGGNDHSVLLYTEKDKLFMVDQYSKDFGEGGIKIVKLALSGDTIKTETRSSVQTIFNLGCD